MVGRLSVTGRAIRRRALVDPVAVTRGTAYPSVSAREREGSLAVIYRGPLPATGSVALRAGLAELPVVFVVRLVTGRTVLWRPRILVARMA